MTRSTTLIRAAALLSITTVLALAGAAHAAHAASPSPVDGSPAIVAADEAADFLPAEGRASFQMDEALSAAAQDKAESKAAPLSSPLANLDADSADPDSAAIWPTEVHVTDCNNYSINYINPGQCVRIWMTVYNATWGSRYARGTITSQNPITGATYLLDDDTILAPSGYSRWFTQFNSNPANVPGPRIITATVDCDTASASIMMGGSGGGGGGGGGGGSAGCPGPILIPGQVVYGTINGWHGNDIYCIDNRYGPGNYRIRMWATSGNLDTFLRVFNSWGQLVIENDDVGPWTLDSQVDIYTTGYDTPSLRLDAGHYEGSGTYGLSVDYWR